MMNLNMHTMSILEDSTFCQNTIRPQRQGKGIISAKDLTEEELIVLYDKYVF